MNQKPLVLVIDDEKFYTNDVALELDGRADVKGFVGPNEFEEHVTPEDIATASYILVDFDYQYTNAVDLGLAEYIRGLGYKGKLILWSLFKEFDEDYTRKIRAHYDVILPKDSFSWQQLFPADEKADRRINC